MTLLTVLMVLCSALTVGMILRVHMPVRLRLLRVLVPRRMVLSVPTELPTVATLP